MLKNTRKGEVRPPQSLPATTAWANGRLAGFTAHHRSIHPAEDIQSAQLWLADGIPIGDMLTMLEAKRRFEFSPTQCRAYAVQILWSAQTLALSESDRIPNPKESRYAAA